MASTEAPSPRSLNASSSALCAEGCGVRKIERTKSSSSSETRNIFAFCSVMAMAAALSLGSCVQEQAESVPSDMDSPEIMASIAAGQTRTCVDADLNVLWEAGDEISVFLKTTENRRYGYQGEGGEASGKFSRVTGPTPDLFAARDYNYGLYPYDETATVDKTGTVTVTVPAVQPYKEDSFAPGMNVMVAASEDQYLAFKNVCGYLTVKLYGDGVKVKDITLRGNAREVLAGAGTVKVSPTEAPVLALGAEAASEVKMEADEAVELGATADEATEFWFVVAPTVFEDGFTVTVTDEEGNVLLEQATQQEVEIVRNVVYGMTAVEVKSGDEVPEDEIEGHKYVEMGPDGLKWATTNVGADSPEEYGDYFAWGETAPKEDYSWATYAHMQEGESSWLYINKYTFDDGHIAASWYWMQVDKTTGESSYIFRGDGLTELEAEDDAASVNWDGTWRTPTDAEWTWLRENCAWEKSEETVTDEEGNSTTKLLGYTVTNEETGNSIFLPAAGFRDGTSLGSAGSLGYYWSSSLDEGFSGGAWIVYFYSGGVLRGNDFRFSGYSVRPVSE